MITAALLNEEVRLRAFLLAGMAQLAYEAEAEERSLRLLAWGLKERRWIGAPNPAPHPTDTECTLIEGDDILLFAFRGTETDTTEIRNILDLLNDGLAAQGIFFGTKVHSGFAHATLAVMNVVAEEVETAGRDRAVWVTGHSLGGAIAQLASFRLCTLGRAPQGVITYGAPRVGGLIWKASAAAAGLTELAERWVNTNDPAPRLPFTIQVPIIIPLSPIWTSVGRVNYVDWPHRTIHLDHVDPVDEHLPTTDYTDHAINRYKLRIWQLLSPEEKNRLVAIFNPILTWRETAGRLVRDGIIPGPGNGSLRAIMDNIFVSEAIDPESSLRVFLTRHF
ncbi:lipase family protein [Flavilitoribacter nigricans]|uniref:Fungal lipase-type domain-containing protein n=1 Tax=Flavilitoribacter nigricans (strain ATCC 23147 / DSM 23189 / NBRC 102662 / NCIMB 1420 / SS-2) TaxID=1122177 RepID=A0A2D0N4J0_FLAN2|nr:lipase family protein [Flavilitoribacter nigricans]PHN02693.1 hypothetical protein CRP01_30380 [Flavilitoribacter nigricans DSM 23189 = NBRC 102662]